MRCNASGAEGLKIVYRPADPKNSIERACCRRLTETGRYQEMTMGVFKFEGITVEKLPKETVPKCLHCRKEFDRLWIKAQGIGIVEQKQSIMCPGCECFLGFGMFSVG